MLRKHDNLTDYFLNETTNYTVDSLPISIPQQLDLNSSIQMGVVGIGEQI